MNSKLFKMISNVFILFGCVGIIINFSPYMANQISMFSLAVLRLSNPSSVIEETQEKFGIDKMNKNTNNITAPIEHIQSAMRPIKTEDGEACEDITATPKDILDLMEEAASQYSEENTDGKTSEESYFGGGELVSFDNVEVQSKIPESFYKLNIGNLLKNGSDLIIKDKKKPTILIYHSHTTEAYSMLDKGFYYNANSRSNDINKSVVRVGDEITRYLEKAGFCVIHDKEIHDTKYGESYASSRANIQKYLEEYPTIEITIDVHRDTITYNDKTKVKPTAVINGKKAAKMMIISGCEYGRVKDFPNWEENLKFNLSVQQKIASEYPELMRPIMFSERKYNMDSTMTSFLLEVGSDANTLDEACYSGRLFGKALGELLNERYVKE